MEMSAKQIRDLKVAEASMDRFFRSVVFMSKMVLDMEAMEAPQAHVAVFQSVISKLDVGIAEKKVSIINLSNQITELKKEIEIKVGTLTFDKIGSIVILSELQIPSEHIKFEETRKRIDTAKENIKKYGTFIEVALRHYEPDMFRQRNKFFDLSTTENLLKRSKKTYFQNRNRFQEFLSQLKQKFPDIYEMVYPKILPFRMYYMDDYIESNPTKKQQVKKTDNEKIEMSKERKRILEESTRIVKNTVMPILVKYGVDHIWKRLLAPKLIDSTLDVEKEFIDILKEKIVSGNCNLKEFITMAAICDGCGGGDYERLLKDLRKKMEENMEDVNYLENKEYLDRCATNESLNDKQQKLRQERKLLTEIWEQIKGPIEASEMQLIKQSIENRLVELTKKKRDMTKKQEILNEELIDYKKQLIKENKYVFGIVLNEESDNAFLNNFGVDMYKTFMNANIEEFRWNEFLQSVEEAIQKKESSGKPKVPIATSSLKRGRED